MATKAELKKKIAAARKSKNSASKALKDLADVKAPKGAHKALTGLRERLRGIRDRMTERIPVLKHRLEAKRHNGAADAVKWAKAQIGATESPAGSNRGPYPVSACQTFTIGYDGVPWCGCFVSLAASKGGAKFPSKSRLAYTPYICADASSGSNGLKKVSTSSVKAGDFIVFNFDGGVPDHVGLAVGPISGGMTDAIEGNTSSGGSGSQDNGGGVFRRQRPVSQVACVARPNY